LRQPQFLQGDAVRLQAFVVTLVLNLLILQQLQAATAERRDATSTRKNAEKQ
jgi:hypothetical protein